MELLGDVGLVESHFGHGSEIVLDIIMVLLCDEAQVDACFVLFGDSAKLDIR